MQNWRDNACLRVALLTLSCFLLTSTGWIMWLYHLTGLTPAIPTDVLTLVVGYLTQALGIGLFALLEQRQQEKQLRLNVVIALVSYVVCLALSVLTPDLAVTLAFGYLSNMLCGYMQGYYLLCLATHVDAGHRGTVFGGAYAASTLLTWLIALPGGGMLTRGLGSLMVCCALTACTIAFVYPPLPTPPLEDEPSARPPADDASLIPLACAVVLLTSATKSAGFGFPISDLEEGVSLELTRLLYGVGLLVAGLASDRDRRFGIVCCAASLVTPFVMLLLTNAGTAATLLWALGYLFYGFFSVFRVLLCSDLASEHNLTRLSGMGLLLGRVGDALGSGLYVALGANQMALVTTTSVLFACAMVLLFALYQRQYLVLIDRPLSEQEIFERFCARHDLSSREREVLRLLLAERSNSEIAAELFVSEATVKYHVRNLLRKTGCHSRVEIMAVYATGE